MGIDWKKFRELETMKNERQYEELCRLLHRYGVFSRHSGYFIYGAGVILNPRYPAMFRPSLFFTRKCDMLAYKNAAYSDAQYTIYESFMKGER